MRLLAVDRCGPARRFARCARGRESTAAALDVERFGVVGWSAGGPHALALAAVAPDRVTRVALVGSMPPVDLVAELQRDVRAAMRVARVSPRLAARGLERWGRMPTPPTGDPACDEAYARGRVESFRHGGLWLARELAYLGRPWGFDLADVRAPVTLWWGKSDSVCPPVDRRGVRGAAAARRSSTSSTATHQLLFSRWRDIVASAAA